MSAEVVARPAKYRDTTPCPGPDLTRAAADAIRARVWPDLGEPRGMETDDE